MKLYFDNGNNKSGDYEAIILCANNDELFKSAIHVFNSTTDVNICTDG